MLRDTTRESYVPIYLVCTRVGSTSNVRSPSQSIISSFGLVVYYRLILQTILYFVDLSYSVLLSFLVENYHSFPETLPDSSTVNTTLTYLFFLYRGVFHPLLLKVPLPCCHISGTSVFPKPQCPLLPRPYIHPFFLKLHSDHCRPRPRASLNDRGNLKTKTRLR